MEYNDNLLKLKTYNYFMNIYILVFVSYFVSLLPGFIDLGIDDITGYILDTFLFIIFTLLNQKFNLYENIYYKNDLLKIYGLITIISFFYYFIKSMIYMTKFLNEINVDIEYYHIILVIFISFITTFIETYNAYYIYLFFMYLKNLI